MAAAAHAAVEPDNPVIVWQPQEGPQTALLACPVFEVFFGGARGGGKTDGMLGDFASHGDLYGEHAIGLMVRRQRTELVETIERSKEIYAPLGAKWHEQDKVWRFANGARLRFAYLENDRDADAYQGHSYTRVYVEEIGNFPSDKPILKLMATLRSGHGVPPGFRATGNPGGPGHQWVRARYIDPAPLGWQVQRYEYLNPFTKTMTVRDRVYIPSRLSDNAFLGDEYVASLQMSGSSELVRAWLEGDWSVITGAYFPEFSLTQHVIEPFEVPRDWTRFRAMDWGSAKPAAVGWWAIAQDEFKTPAGRIIPKGALVSYREWYVAKGPNEGLKLTAEEVGRGIAERELSWERRPPHKGGILYGVADPAMFNEDGGPSIAERMAVAADVGFSKADNKRQPGWDQLRARLKGDERPMIYWFSTCVDSIRTIPALQHDERKPEDVDSDGEDHAGDMARYACMSRPYTRHVPEQVVPRFAYEAQPDGTIKSSMTFNEIIARQVRRMKERDD